MFKKRDRNEVRVIRHARVRKKISGTPDMPRLCVYRSNSNIYAQVIDDTKGCTLVSASTLDANLKGQLEEVDKKGAAKLVGKLVAERALQAGIKAVVFDRGGYVYTGRVAELAAGAREAGLDF
ncbi:MAG: 50S ribosomal protein L18 [Clostridia bacterium]|nr:50S ribosomal protein L18 [Clostridia bacterium]